MGFPGPSDVDDSYDIKGMNNDVEKNGGTLGVLPYGPTSNHSIALLRPQASQEFESSTSQSSFYGTQSTEQKLSLRDSISMGVGTSHLSAAKISPQYSDSTFLQSEANNVSTVADGPPSSSLYQGNIFGF